MNAISETWPSCNMFFHDCTHIFYLAKSLHVQLKDCLFNEPFR